MGNSIKLVSGFILFAIGAIISYEAYVYNLLDILLIVGLLIAVIGVVVIASYAIESNVDKTADRIKEFLESKEHASGFERKNTSEGPLKIRYDYQDFDDDYEDLVIEEYDDSTPGEYYEEYSNGSNTVLRGIPREAKDVNLDNPLVFTPQYGRPLKVTRVPKRRSADVPEDDVEPIVVETDKSDEIKRALEEPAQDEEVLTAPRLVNPEVTEPREIRIDINDPESLPVPKSLNSHIISNDDVLTSQEAFDQLAVHINKEIMLEIPSLNKLSDRFLSHVPTSYSRVIIDEFDPSDMSYMFLISSLLKQGVHIKTVPKVHTVNLITDDAYAMIISEGQNDAEYGAIYDDRDSISNIRSSFEKTWNIASNLDESIIMNSLGGSA